MILLTHLWQSTICAGVATVLVAGLRQAPGRVRHRIWLCASLKFLLPFGVLAAAGRAIGAWLPATATPSASITVRWLDRSRPFWNLDPLWTAGGSGPAIPQSQVIALGALFAWAAGALVTAVWRWRAWRAVARLASAASPLEQGREADALRRAAARQPRMRRTALVACGANVEPGVIGVLRPKVLWPAGLSDRLSDAELDAVVAHEACHVVRHDNAVALLQMIVETLFWFYPVVWWLGARLLSERERACDEEVLQMGADKRRYAEAILKVCGFSLGSPIAFVAGVRGSNLAERIEQIMRHQSSPRLSASRRVLIGVVGALVAAAPLTTGVLDARRGPVPFPADACDVTRPVNERPPDDPGSMPFAGTPGPWYVNADRTMWAWGGTPAPNTLGTKVLWVRPSGLALSITARRLDGDAVPVSISLPATPRTFQPSGLAFPTSGCWEVMGSTGENTLRFTIDVRDHGMSASAPAVGRSGAASQPIFDAKWGNVDTPRLLTEAKPGYNREAMDAGIQGTVTLEAVVLPDGTVGVVTVTRSLDTVHGLDDEAVRTLKKWRFDPGTRDGMAVPVSVEVEMSFTLK